MGYKWTVLVGKERMCSGIMATAVPQKGSVGRFAVDKCLEFIGECGDANNPIVVKSDQENAIELLVEVADERPRVIREGGLSHLVNLATRAHINMTKVFSTLI